MKEKLITYIYQIFRQENGIDLPKDELTLKRVTEAIEKAWTELKKVDRTEINLPFIFADANGPKHITVGISKTLIKKLLTEKLNEKVDIEEKSAEINKKIEPEENTKRIQIEVEKNKKKIELEKIIKQKAAEQKKKNAQNRKADFEKRDGKSFIRKYQQLDKKQSRNKYNRLKTTKQVRNQPNMTLIIMFIIGVLFALGIIPLIIYFLVG